MVVISPTEEMVQAGQAQLNGLNAEITDLRHNIAVIQENIEALTQGTEQLQQQMKDAQHVFDQAQSDLQVKINIAKMAQGTPREKHATQDVSAARKLVKSLQLDLDNVTKLTTEGIQGMENTINNYLGEYRELQDKLLIKEEMLSVTQASFNKVFDELGVEKYQMALEELDHKQTQINHYKEMLVSEQASLHDFLESTAEELRAWPDLLREFQKQQPYEDSFTICVESVLHYLSVILREARNMPTMKMPADMERRALRTQECLVIHPEEVWSAIRHPEVLRQKQDRIQKILDEYRDVMSNR